jgi:hypothetical protein
MKSAARPSNGEGLSRSNPPRGIVERKRGKGDECGHEDRGGDERKRCDLASALSGAIAKRFDIRAQGDGEAKRSHQRRVDWQPRGAAEAAGEHDELVESLFMGPLYAHAWSARLSKRLS